MISQDLLEHDILRSKLEPLSLSVLIAQTLIFPLGVFLQEELEELEVNWTPKYPPYYIDSVYTPTSSPTANNIFIQRISEQEGPEENWNTQYPQRPSPYSFDISPIRGNTQNTT